MPFLSAAEVARLRDAHLRSVRGPTENTITTDYADPDRAVMRATRDAVGPVLEPHLAERFVDHELVMATFVAKYPGHMSSMYLHDDRTYVDDRRARSVTIWIPLHDVSPEAGNGTLELVPRSHLLDRGWSGTGSPDLVRPYERFLRRRLVGVTATAGTAVVYDTRTLHASAANATGERRVALACAVAPREAPLLHVVAAGDRVRVHRVTPAFYVDHHPADLTAGMPADCPVVDEFEDRAALTPDDVAAVYGEVPEVDPVVPHAVWRDGDPATFPWLPHADGSTRRGRVVQTLRLARGRQQELALADGDALRAVSAPAVGAGVRTDAAAADLVPGRVVTPGASPVTVWNEGPGDLVAEVLARRRFRRRRGPRRQVRVGPAPRSGPRR